nr:MAG TPA: hypothetical protein [Caudoviricetes sp.]
MGGCAVVQRVAQHAHVHGFRQSERILHARRAAHVQRGGAHVGQGGIGKHRGKVPRRGQPAPQTMQGRAVMPGAPVVTHAGKVLASAELSTQAGTVMEKRAVPQAEVTLPVGNAAVMVAAHFVKDGHFQTCFHVLPHIHRFPVSRGKPRGQGVHGGRLKVAVTALSVMGQRPVVQRRIAYRIRHGGPHGHIQRVQPRVMQMAEWLPACMRGGTVMEQPSVMLPEQAVVIPDGAVMQRKAPRARVGVFRPHGKAYAVRIREGRFILKAGSPGHGPQDGACGLVLVHQPAEPGQDVRVQPLFRDFHQPNVELRPAQPRVVGSRPVVHQRRVMAAHVVHRHDNRARKAVFRQNPHQALNLAAQLVPGKSVDHTQAVAFVRVVACAQNAPAGPVIGYALIVRRGRVPLAAQPQNVLAHIVHVQRQPLCQRRYRAGPENGGPVQPVVKVLPERACHGLFLRHPDRLQVQGFQYGQTARRNLHIFRRAFPADALHAGNAHDAGGQPVPHHILADGKARNVRVVAVGKHGAHPAFRLRLHAVRVAGKQFQHGPNLYLYRLRRSDQQVVIDDDGIGQSFLHSRQQTCRGHSRCTHDHHIHRAFPARVLVRHIHIHHAGNGERGGFIGRPRHPRLALPGQHIAPPQGGVVFLVRAFLQQPVRSVGHARNAFHRRDQLAYLACGGVGPLAVFLSRGGHGHGCRTFRQHGQLVRHIAVDIALAVGQCAHDAPGGDADVPRPVPAQKQHVAPRLRGALAAFVHLRRVRIQPFPRGFQRDGLLVDNVKKVVELPQAPGEKLDDAPRDALVQVEACGQITFGRVVVLHGLDALEQPGADFADVFGKFHAHSAASRSLYLPSRMTSSPTDLSACKTRFSGWSASMKFQLTETVRLFSSQASSDVFTLPTFTRGSSSTRMVTSARKAARVAAVLSSWNQSEMRLPKSRS